MIIPTASLAGMFVLDFLTLSRKKNETTVPTKISIDTIKGIAILM
jgi:hypothetical protein